MTIFHNFVVRLAAIAVLFANSIAINAQTSPPTNRSASMVLNFRLEKDRVPVGQSLVAILIVDNLSDRYLTIYDGMYRVHVDRKDGEAPTTVRQRCWTGELLPGDACLPTTLSQGAWAIFPSTSDFRKIQLGYLYDLSVPGLYTVYAEVMDAPSQKWLRTKTIQFEIHAPTQ
jgi:hypothetical protein